jgi:CRP/FNR family cyclic AMP-dependent transcriptional regulator
MNEVDQLLAGLKPESAEYLEKYFRNAPEWLMDEFQTVEIPKGTIFIREKEPARMIYILTEGLVTATDLRIDQATYDYMRFAPVKIFGAMEFLAGIEEYQTSLYTEEDCCFLKITKDKFAHWMMTDINALAMQTREMTRYLVEQNREDRLNLFLEGEDRIALFLTNYYRKTAENGKAVLTMSRAEIGRSTALSVRTVNRILTGMISEGRLIKLGHKLVLNREYYQTLMQQLAKKIDVASIVNE